jgi:hypothetical protein
MQKLNTQTPDKLSKSCRVSMLTPVKADRSMPEADADVS